MFEATGIQRLEHRRVLDVLEASATFGRVTNLFDRDYEEALGYPALGRSAMVGLRVATSR